MWLLPRKPENVPLIRLQGSPSNWTTDSLIKDACDPWSNNPLNCSLYPCSLYAQTDTVANKTRFNHLLLKHQHRHWSSKIHVIFMVRGRKCTIGDTGGRPPKGEIRLASARALTWNTYSTHAHVFHFSVYIYLCLYHSLLKLVWCDIYLYAY